MRKLALALIACGTALVPVLSSAPAHAQTCVAARTWVATTGIDSSGSCCAFTSPCRTLNHAITKTFTLGDINCVDTGDFTTGELLITRSVNIDCHGLFATLGGCSANGITIDIPPGGSDSLRTVRLRNLVISGSGNGSRCGTNGIRIVNAAVVSLEDVLITDHVARGVSDQRTTGGRLTLTNSILRNNGGSGLIVLPASGQTRIDVAVDNVVSEGNGWGMVFTNGARAMVARSLIANNPFAGIDVEGDAQVALDNSTVSNNGTGLFTFGSTAVLDVSNSNIAFNAQAASGQWFSFGNNRSHRNTAVGTLPTAMGAITHDVGQQ
jgi:hypothetical protein